MLLGRPLHHVALVVCCSTCAPCGQAMRYCPICRAFVEGTIDVFYAVEKGKTIYNV